MAMKHSYCFSLKKKKKVKLSSACAKVLITQPDCTNQIIFIFLEFSDEDYIRKVLSTRHVRRKLCREQTHE